jgi:hypothetical protein
MAFTSISKQAYINIDLHYQAQGEVEDNNESTMNEKVNNAVSTIYNWEF